MTNKDDAEKRLPSQSKEEAKLQEAIEHFAFDRMLIKIWRKRVAIFLIGALISLLIGLVVVSRLLDPIVSWSDLDTAVVASSLAGVASTLFSASLILNGIAIGLVPVSVFFFLGQFRSYRGFQSQEKRITDKKRGSQSDYRDKVVPSIVGGLTGYATRYLEISIGLQFGLLIFYFSVSSYAVFGAMAKLAGSALFSIVDMIVVMIIYMGIFPLVKLSALLAFVIPVDQGSGESEG